MPFEGPIEPSGCVSLHFSSYTSLFIITKICTEQFDTHLNTKIEFFQLKYFKIEKFSLLEIFFILILNVNTFIMIRNYNTQKISIINDLSTKAYELPS